MIKAEGDAVFAFRDLIAILSSGPELLFPQFFKDWWDFFSRHRKCESIPGGRRAVSKDRRLGSSGHLGKGIGAIWRELSGREIW